MARRIAKPSANNGAGHADKILPLRLVRVEGRRRRGIRLIFDSKNGEMSWLLEQTSVTELLALILRGRMRRGRRIEVDFAEMTIEPPADRPGNPQLCIAMGPLELCASVDRPTAKAIKADLDRAMKRPG